MKNLLRALLPMRSPKPASRAVRRARPELEALEDRLFAQQYSRPAE
jgi:hypothetical protein